MKFNLKRYIGERGRLFTSIALRQYPTRLEYLRDLVRRLDKIPQILPIKYLNSARSRGDHCRNIARVAASLTYPDGNNKPRGKLILSAMLHDIGHGLHGHASERAINAWAGRNIFSNDLQSSRLIYFTEHKSSECAPVFLTPALEHLEHISSDTCNRSSTESSTPKSRVLEFLDDLENAIGDGEDLLRNKMCGPSKIRRTLAFPEKFSVKETPQAAVRWLEHFGFDGSYSSLLRLTSEGSEVSEALTCARREIDATRREIYEITEADVIAERNTIDICEELSSANGRYSAEWIIDAVSTLEFESSHE